MTGTTKELYEETVASQVKVWDDEIEHLDARADIVMAQIEDRYYHILKLLRDKEKEIKQQLEALRAAEECDATWQQISAALTCSTRDMKLALNHAAEEIEHDPPSLEIIRS